MLVPPWLRLCAPALLLVGCLESGARPVAADAGHVDAGHVDGGSGNLCATSRLTCGEHATCVDDPDTGSACHCQVGYDGDGQTCTDVDECDDNSRNSCDPHATCANLEGSYSCTCQPGYLGNGHETVDSNEVVVPGCTASPVGLCAVENGGCALHATCSVSNSQVSCACDTGYSGDGHTCAPVPVCGTSAAHCDAHATCTDLPQGGYLCTCGAGFHGSGFACVDVDECQQGLSNCGTDAVCTNTAGSFSCACRPGFEGDGYDCLDVDECAANTAHCAANAACINTLGSFTCACPAGYQGDGHTCTSLDQCALNIAHCGANAYCQPTTGSYRCLCANGYTGDGYNCTDVDECLSGAAHCATNAHCSNLPGGFQCSCNLGYQGDGATSCTVVNQCTNGSANCSPDATCTPFIGSYDCTCNTGFEGTGAICTDVDECARGSNLCDPNAVCTNTSGSYTCGCNPGFSGNGQSCTDINECTNGTSLCGGAAPCVNTPGDYFCQCLAGMEGGASCHSLGKHLSASDTFGCTLSSRTAGTLSCWGTSLTGGLGLGATITKALQPTALVTPAPTNQWTAVSSSATHACGIRSDGTLYCWGKPDATAVTVPTPAKVGTATNWVDVAAGRSFTCGIRGDGTLWCWGRNDLGQVGDGTLTNSTTPRQIGASTHWTVVTAGDHHACAIQEGTLYCWGGNDAGQLGLSGVPASASAPTAIAMPTHWGSVRAAPLNTCAISDGGTLWCWGDNTYGQLGNGTLVRTAVPVQVGTLTSWTSVGPGTTHTCAIRTDQSAWCWGDNSVGQLGTGNQRSSLVPVRASLNGFQDWVEIVAGDSFTCARHSANNSNTVACWGSNDGARLGMASDGSVSSPVPVSGGQHWLEVSAGVKSACGISDSNVLFCWGDNTSGQLGNNSTDAQQSPALAIPTSTRVVWSHVAVGRDHACGVSQDGQLWCWGDNTFGQLGIPTATAARLLQPTPVSASTKWTGVASGAFHSCGLQLNTVTGGNDLYCWGRNDSGQVGNGTQTNADISLIGAGTSWSFIAAGDAHTCARDAAGGLACWGANTFGQVGNNTNNVALTPQTILVAGILGWTNIFLGTGMSCGVTSGANADLYCWGLNNIGQLGVGDLANRKVPTLVTPTPSGDPQNPAEPFSWNTQLLTGAASDTHVCAVQSDSSLWCWGKNFKGEFGDGQQPGNPPLAVLRPVRTSNLADWNAVVTGHQFTCGTQGSNALYCFGLNDRGQLGDGLSWQLSPIQQP